MQHGKNERPDKYCPLYASGPLKHVLKKAPEEHLLGDPGNDDSP